MYLTRELYNEIDSRGDVTLVVLGSRVSIGDQCKVCLGGILNYLNTPSEYISRILIERQ